MLLFYEYQRLPRRIKQLATQMWAEEVMLCCGAKNPNQIPQKLESVLGITGYARGKQKQKYWYKKLNGEPINTDREFEIIGGKYESTINILLSPLWLMLTATELSQTDLTRLTDRLSTDIRDIFHNHDGYFLHPISMNIMNAHPLETITALVLYHLWYRSAGNQQAALEASEYIFNNIMVLYAQRYTRNTRGHKLCLYLSTYIEVFDNRKTTEKFHLSLYPKEESDTYCLPINLEQISTRKSFEACLSLYIKIAQYLQKHLNVSSKSIWFILGTEGPKALAERTRYINNKPIFLPRPKKPASGIFMRYRDKYLK